MWLWIIGIIFTLGTVEDWSTMSIWEMLIVVIGIAISWPVFLGRDWRDHIRTARRG